MACFINTITNPDSSAEFDLKESVNVTWTNNGNCTGVNSKRVTEIKLQRIINNIWSDVQVLWTGETNVTANSQTVTIPDSVPVYDDVYRLRLKYAQISE